VNSKTVYGSRLQGTCRSLGLSYKEVGKWVKNSNRHYPDRWAVTGVELSEADAQTLTAHLEAKANKEQVRRERAAALTPQDREAKAAKRREAAHKRETKEIAAICQSVLRRSELSETDVLAFAEHANEPGEGRVVRTRTACSQDFDTKVYMALVAWVRHKKTPYDDARQAAKDSAYRDYLDAKEWGADRDERAELLDEARDAMSGVRDRLHRQYTAEAVAWLKARRTPAQVEADRQLKLAEFKAKLIAQRDCSRPVATHDGKQRWFTNAHKLTKGWHLDVSQFAVGDVAGVSGSR